MKERLFRERIFFFGMVLVLIVIAFILIYRFRIEREEQQLIETFGEQYIRYQHVTGRLLPKLGRNG